MGYVTFMQELLLQLKNYEINEKVSPSPNAIIFHELPSYWSQVAEGGNPDVSMGSIPAGTLIKTHYSASVPNAAEGQEKGMVSASVERRG